MKKNLPLVIAIFLLFSDLKAQDVLNQGFEDWSSPGTFEVPDVTPLTSGFTTSNYEVFYKNFAAINATKVTGAGGSGFALRFETKEFFYHSQLDTLFGYGIWGGNPNDDDNPIFPGGFAFADQNVTGISVDLRYDINIASPGLLLVQFKKNGLPIDGAASTPGLYMFPIYGNQSTFTTSTFNFSPALTQVPDSVVIGFVSNNPFVDGVFPYPGNFMEVDNITFTGTSMTVPNGDLESWESSPAVEFPDDWNIEGFESYVDLKSTDANEATYAISLPVMVGGNEGWVVTAEQGYDYYDEINDEYRTVPGTELSGKPLSLSFNYKYTSPGIDTAVAFVTVTKYNAITGKQDILGNGQIDLRKKSVYGDTTITINYFSSELPDSAYIQFSASRDWGGNTPVTGSILLVDNVRFDYSPTAVNNAVKAEFVSVYPNPTRDQVTIEGKSMNLENVRIMNSLQQEVKDINVKLSGNKAVIDLSGYHAGIYYLIISEGEKNTVQMVVKQ